MAAYALATSGSLASVYLLTERLLSCQGGRVAPRGVGDHSRDPKPRLYDPDEARGADRKAAAEGLAGRLPTCLAGCECRDAAALAGDGHATSHSDSSRGGTLHLVRAFA